MKKADSKARIFFEATQCVFLWIYYSSRALSSNTHFRVFIPLFYSFYLTWTYKLFDVNLWKSILWKCVWPSAKHHLFSCKEQKMTRLRGVSPTKSLGLLDEGARSSVPLANCARIPLFSFIVCSFCWTGQWAFLNTWSFVQVLIFKLTTPLII